MSEPMKVTHFVLSLDCGGVERAVLALVCEGQRLGQQVAVVCLERPGDLAAQVEELGPALYCLQLGNVSSASLVSRGLVSNAEGWPSRLCARVIVKAAAILFRSLASQAF
jgi:hypothetical protein